MRKVHIFVHTVYENYVENTFETNEDCLEVPKVDLKRLLEVLRDRMGVEVDYDFLKEVLESEIEIRKLENCPTEYYDFVINVIVYITGFVDYVSRDLIIMTDKRELGEELLKQLKQYYWNEPKDFDKMLYTILNFTRKHGLEIDVLEAKKSFDAEGTFCYIITRLVKY